MLATTTFVHCRSSMLTRVPTPLPACRCSAVVLTSVSTVLVSGALASGIALKPLLPYLRDVARADRWKPPTESMNLFFVSIPTELGLLLAWGISSLLIVATIFYRDGHFRSLSVLRVLRNQNGYRPVATSDNSMAGGKSAGKRPAGNPPPHLDPPPASPDAYSMFDPADLPPRLAEYANMVYSACEDLGNFFGFQDSSVRNQAEHLLILLSNNRRYMSSHILPPSVQPPSPIHALHAKVFSNYVKWCRAMGVPHQFSKMNTSMSAPPAVASRVVDLVLFFCIWGEGANLRHMPECLWFLYHKMMEEYIKCEGYTQTRSLYAGHFLDNVVTPLYDIFAVVR